MKKKIGTISFSKFTLLDREKLAVSEVYVTVLPVMLYLLYRYYFKRIIFTNPEIIVHPCDHKTM